MLTNNCNLWNMTAKSERYSIPLPQTLSISRPQTLVLVRIYIEIRKCGIFMAEFVYYYSCTVCFHINADNQNVHGRPIVGGAEGS